MIRRVISCSFLLLILFQVPLMAQSFGVSMGIQKPGDDRYWLSGSYRMYLRENFSLNPEIGYSRTSRTDEFCLDPLGCSESNALFRDLNVGMHALYTIPKDRFSFSFGGGVGAHFLKSEVSIDNNDPIRPDIELSSSDIQPGLHFLGEFDIAVTDRLSVFLVNRSEFVRKFNDNFKLYGGVRWRF
jgi:hypothetical protein